MNAIKVTYALISLLVVLPIWFYLLHSILVAIQASQLQWFLFWVYVPIGIFVAILQKIVEVAAES